MPFDKKTELKQPEQRIELVFLSGRPRAKDELSMPPSAYIAMGWNTRDEDNRVRLTTEEMSVDAIDAQVREIKGRLDACVAEARARFAASNGRAMRLTEHERRSALGRWGELKSLVLLQRANFTNVRDLNGPTPNHPFADTSADRNGLHYIIGVKTRCKFKDDGRLNEDYNMVKRDADVTAIAEGYQAQPAWVTIQVIPELQTFSAFFGKLTTERLSVSMRERDIANYKRDGNCLTDQETDPTILAEWSNGGYALSRRT